LPDSKPDSTPDTDAEHDARTVAADARTDAAEVRSTDAADRATDADARAANTPSGERPSAADRAATAADRVADALDRTADAADRSADSIDRFAATARAAVETASKSVAQLRSEHAESVARTDAIGESLADRADAADRAEHIAAERPAPINPKRIAAHVTRIGERFDTLTHHVAEATDDIARPVVDAPVEPDGAGVADPPRSSDAVPGS